jgi:hypothetical protein
LNDPQGDVLTRELHQIIQNDQYPLSPRVVVLKEIMAKLRPRPRRCGGTTSTDLCAAHQGQMAPPPGIGG